MRHPLFFAIVMGGCALAGCRTQPLAERTRDLGHDDLAVAVSDLSSPDLASTDLACDCVQQPLPDHCKIPCILI